MKKIVLGGILPLLFAACSTNSTEQVLDWRDSLCDENLSADVRYNIAYDHVYELVDMDDYSDSIALMFLTEDLLNEPIKVDVQHRIILDRADDGNALLMTVEGGGTMVTGTSYILYRKRDGSCVVKKVAYPQPDPEGGVVSLLNTARLLQQRMDTC